MESEEIIMHKNKHRLIQHTNLYNPLRIGYHTNRFRFFEEESAKNRDTQMAERARGNPDQCE